tara:strand:+ start:2004 stop:2261 length:258 start_codon:yes stop_codon:yes gene_type:complete
MVDSIDKIIKDQLQATSIQTNAALSAERDRVSRRLTTNINTINEYTERIKEHIQTLTGDDFHTILHHCEMIESNTREVLEYLTRK